MAESYEQAFQDILINVRNSSPNAATCLEVLADECGTQLAFYDAFILLFLSARSEQNHPRPLSSYNLHHFQDFTFFEQAKDNPHAVALFTRALRAYQKDRATS